MAVMDSDIQRADMKIWVRRERGDFWGWIVGPSILTYVFGGSYKDSRQEAIDEAMQWLNQETDFGTEWEDIAPLPKFVPGDSAWHKQDGEFKKVIVLTDAYDDQTGLVWSVDDEGTVAMPWAELHSSVPES